MRVKFTAGADDHDRRLESVLRKLLPHQTLGALHKALRHGDVRLNGAKAGPDSRVATGDTLAIWDALVIANTPRGRDSPPAPVPRDWVLYEGADLLVINKPSGLLVHRGDGGKTTQEAPLDDRVRAFLQSGAPSSLSFRPGPLHRLDRETSGALVFSRTLVGARAFSEAVARREVRKTYLAVMRGDLTAPVDVDERLTRDRDAHRTEVADDGEEASTHFRPLARAEGLTLVEVDLGTGRTHQIRVHAQSIGHPLAGDAQYGGGSPPPGLDVPWLLHAWKLETALFPRVVAPLPPGCQNWLKEKFKFLS